MHGSATRIWPKVAGPIVNLITGTYNTRKPLVNDTNIRIRFTVFEQDVILWLILLDQVIFQQESIGFGIDNGKLNGFDLGDKLYCFFVVLCRAVEIRADTLPYIN